MVRLTDRPDMTLDVYRGRKTTMQCNNNLDPSYKGNTHIIAKFHTADLVYL